MQDMVFKIQTDITGELVLIYDVPDRDYFIQITGKEAKKVKDKYNMHHILEKKYVRGAMVNGLPQLGEVIENYKEET